jgi:hypothetical protein
VRGHRELHRRVRGRAALERSFPSSSRLDDARRDQTSCFITCRRGAPAEAALARIELLQTGVDLSKENEAFDRVIN